MMRICRLFSLLAVLSFYSFNALSSSEVFPLQNDWVDSHDGQILKSLQEDGFLKSKLKVERIIGLDGLQSTVGASKAGRILFINETNNDGTLSYVVKETECHQEFKREQELLQSKAINNCMNLMATRKESRFPLLTPYFHTKTIEVNGSSVHVTLMGRAFGTSLKSIRDSLFSGMHLHDQALFCEKQMVEMGTNIGTQMGNLTKLYFETNGTLLVHPDAGYQNFMYDAQSGQFSWIDLGGIYETKFAKTNSFGGYLFYEKEMLKTIWWSLFPSKDRNSFLDIWDIKNQKSTSLKQMVEENGLEALKKHRLGILAANAFIGAYTEITSGLLSAADRDNSENNFLDAIKGDRSDYDKAIDSAFEGKAEDVKSYLYAPILSEESSKKAVKAPQNEEQVTHSKLRTFTSFDIVLAQDNVIFYLDKLFYNDRNNSSMETKYMDLFGLIREQIFGYDSYTSTDSRNYKNNIKVLQDSTKVKEVIGSFTAEFIEQDNSLSIIDRELDSYFEQMKLDPKQKSEFRQKLLSQLKEKYGDLVYNKIIEYNQELAKKPPVRL